MIDDATWTKCDSCSPTWFDDSGNTTHEQPSRWDINTEAGHCPGCVRELRRLSVPLITPQPLFLFTDMNKVLAESPLNEKPKRQVVDLAAMLFAEHTAINRARAEEARLNARIASDAEARRKIVEAV